MARKLDEYFKAGVKLVWLVDPKTKTVRVYTAVDQFVRAHCKTRRSTVVMCCRASRCRSPSCSYSLEPD